MEIITNKRKKEIGKHPKSEDQHKITLYILCIMYYKRKYKNKGKLYKESLLRLKSLERSY